MGFFNFFSTSGPTQTQTNSSDSFSTPYWQQFISGLNNTLGSNPITPYGGPTVAPMSPYQNVAGDMIYNLATNGTPAYNMAQAQIANQASGATVNPYATTANPYMGSNPYMDQVINQSNSRIADAYSRGTAAQTDAAFNQAGAYGGSAYQQQTEANQRALADSLALNTSNQLNQNYYNNANLAENSLNRATNAFQNQQQNALQGAQLGLQSQGTDLAALQGLYGYGAAQQGQTQNILNAMNNYYSQAQQAPFMGYDLMGNALSRYSAANNQQTMQGPGTSGITNAIGAGTSIYAIGQAMGWWK